MAGMNPPWLFVVAIDAEGNPIPGAKLVATVAGSTNIPKPIFADQAMTTEHPHPLVADAAGRFPQFFMQAGGYRFLLTDSQGIQVMAPADYVSGIGGSGYPDPSTSGYLHYDQDTGIYSWQEIDIPLTGALCVWTILKDSDPTTPDFGLGGDDLNHIFRLGYGVAASMAQTTEPESDLSIWYLRGTTWENRQWVEEPQDIGQAILNINHGNFGYLHTHPEYREDDRAEPLSNYPAGLYTIGRDSGDGYEWTSLVIKEFPEPAYAVTSLLQYDATGKAFVWLPYDELKATPIGPAGGDLFGTYPDPRVKELTGVPSMLTFKEATFDWLNPNVSPYNNDRWASGAGIGFGKAYLGGAQAKCWMACSQLGELWVSYDNFATTVNTAYIELPYFNNLRYAGIYYVKMPGTSDYYWIFTAQGGRYSLKDVAANYNTDGTPIIANMKAISFVNAADINAMAFSDSILVFVGNGTSIRYAEAADISVAGETLTITLHVSTAHTSGSDVYVVPGGVTGGIGYSGSMFLVDERDRGYLYWSTDGKNWKSRQILSCTYQDGTTVSDTVLASGSDPGHLSVTYNQWSGILYANDVWVICNPRLYTGTAPSWPGYDAWTPYLFSYDGLHWNAYQPTKEELAGSDAFKASFYKVAYGNGQMLATNQNAAQAADGQPPLYQLLIDQIAAHRRLVCEKGLTVAGSAYLLDLPNATALGTDASGKVIATAGGSDDHKLLAEVGDTVIDYLKGKLVDSSGNPFASTAYGGGRAVVIPTGTIAGTPNGQALFDYSLYETKNTIAQDGTGSGNSYGNRGFAFISNATRTMTKARIFIAQAGGTYIRLGVYDQNGVLLAKSNRVAVAPGLLWCPFTASATLVGGERYYLAYWTDDTTGNIKFGCLSGRNTESDSPQAQLFDTNNEMPNNLGTSGTRTAYRPWMMISE